MQGIEKPDRELLDAAAVCGHLVAADSVYALLAQHRDRLFPDEMFGDLFASGRGRPSVPGSVMAVVLVLQALEAVLTVRRLSGCVVMCAGRLRRGWL